MNKDIIKLDSKDKKILKMLKQDCKMSVKNIAKQINSPITTVYSKIKRMEKTGVIKGYRAILNDKKMGVDVTAFVCISCMPSHLKGSGEDRLKSDIKNNLICKRLLEIPEIEEIQVVTGPWDIIAKIKAESVDMVGEIAFNEIRGIEGVTNTLTLVSIGDIKSY